MKRRNYLNELIQNRNHQQIKELIIKQFSRKKGPQKKFVFYKTIVNLYGYYPKTITNIIETVPQWGYNKDYMFFLLASRKNENITRFIYDLLINRLKNDFQLYQKRQKISTLAKWLPRENSSFDKKLCFVTTFCKLYYPKYFTNINTAKKKYRKLLKNLTKYLNVVEQKTNTKEIENIDFEKISRLCLKNNMTRILNNEKSKEKLINFLTCKFLKCDIEYLVFKVLFGFQIEQDVINKIWKDHKRYFIEKTENMLDFDLSKYNIFIDLSRNIYNDKLIQDMISIIIIVNNKKGDIIINAKRPYKLILNPNLDFCNLVHTIFENMIDSKKLEIAKISNVNDNGKKMMIIAHENIIINNDIDYKNYDMWILKRCKLIKKSDYIVGTIFGNITKTNYKLNKLKEIIEKSDEFNHNIFYVYYKNIIKNLYPQ